MIEIKSKNNRTLITIHADSLTESDLSGAILPHARLVRMDLQRANLSRANLVGADMSYSDLTSADLSGADMTHTDLSCSNLTDANMSGTILSAAVLYKANLTRANLNEAKLIGVSRSADFSSANLTNAVLTNTRLAGVNFVSANLSHLDLTNSEYNASTQWPTDFDPIAHGAMHHPASGNLDAILQQLSKTVSQARLLCVQLRLEAKSINRSNKSTNLPRSIFLSAPFPPDLSRLTTNDEKRRATVEFLKEASYFVDKQYDITHANEEADSDVFLLQVEEIGELIKKANAKLLQLVYECSEKGRP